MIEPFGHGDHAAGLNISLLGPMKLIQDGAPSEITGPKRKALLTLLALNLGRPVGREEIIEALWHGERTGREESTLRVHISHLRDELEPLRHGEPTAIVTKGSAYMLSPEYAAVDVHLFERLRLEGRVALDEDPDSALSLLSQALALWRGRALQDVEYEEFAQASIRNLDLARQQTIENRAQALIRVGDDSSAVDDLEPLVRSDPTREHPLLLLMKALYRTGRQSAALRAARRHRRELAAQGLEPSPRLTLLEDQILNHDPELLPPDVVSAAGASEGRSVRGYELREKVGEGSVGVVFRAFQPSVGREVAVKVIDPDLAQTPEFVRKFVEEARVIANLEHPHIVPLYDFWREPTGAFLIMRWMDGGSMADRMDRPWHVEELGRVFVQVADALGFAHSAGVVHRDVSPANILFDTVGNAYLCDFRLAVQGVETGPHRSSTPARLGAPYAAPELTQGEGPTVASDIFSLGVMLRDAAALVTREDGGGAISEIMRVATSSRPADRYPDMAAFAAALREALGDAAPPMPREVRRNPFKGLEAFDEGDHADFYGRDDVVDSLLDSVRSRGLTALVGPSGSGKSSVVKAGLVPQLRRGAIPESDEWTIVHMVPGVDPFDEFHVGMRSAAFGDVELGLPHRDSELRHEFESALDGPNSHGVLVIDQFEELFSSEVEEGTRERFLDQLVELALHPDRQIRIVLTLRADFADRPLAHPRFGELMARATVLLPPMRPEQIEDVIRLPAARVGVRIEPGLISEMIRDIAASSAYLPHLEYMLSELFEQRTEDRLTVRSYRSLGGAQGVLERRAEATFSGLDSEGRASARQLFLRMVHLAEHGEETRRRLPITELDGLGSRADVDAALEAFTGARLVVYDRDPVSRTPTIEVAHETVISQWTRLRIWIDEARADLLAHRRLSAASVAWADSGEDPAYHLTGGPLAAALEIAESDRVGLNDLERRFVEASQAAEQRATAEEEARRYRETRLRQRSRRRLLGGVTAGVIAVIIGVLGGLALVERGRANDLAAAEERRTRALELAAASGAAVAAGETDHALTMAVEAADLMLAAGEEIPREVTEALHFALITPRSEVLAEGAGGELGGNVLDYSPDGELIVVIADDGGAFVLDTDTGDEVSRVRVENSDVLGVSFEPGGGRFATIHADEIREWDARTGTLTRELPVPPALSVTTAAYSDDGRYVAVGTSDGSILVYDTFSERLVAEIEAHGGAVKALDFDDAGRRLVSAGEDLSVRVLDARTGAVLADLPLPYGDVIHVAWNPSAPPRFAPEGAFAATTRYGEMWLYRASGERITAYGNGNNPSHSMAFSPLGELAIAAGGDGVARIYGTWTGGEEAIILPTGGVPLRDAEFNPVKPLSYEVATVGVDGTVHIWRDLLGSELPGRNLGSIAPGLDATPDGERYVIVGRTPLYGFPSEFTPTADVVESTTRRTLASTPSLGNPRASDPAITPDGAFAAFMGPYGVIEIVEVESGNKTLLAGSKGAGRPLAFSEDGTLLATVLPDLRIALWDTHSGELKQVLAGHGGLIPANSSDPAESQTVSQLEFRPGGSELVSGGYDGAVRAWNAETGEGRLLKSFDYEVISLEFSPDGTMLVVAERTGDIHAIDPDSGETLFDFAPVSGPPTDLVFSPDGTQLGGAGPGHIAHVWDVASGRLVRRFQGSIYAPSGVAFTDGGDELLVVGAVGVLRRYLLNPEAMVELARSVVSASPGSGD